MDVHVGMWHDFPMYSEGCGSGYTLWQAALALNRRSISSYFNDFYWNLRLKLAEELQLSSGKWLKGS